MSTHTRTALVSLLAIALLGWFLSHLVENAQVDWDTRENYIWLPDSHTALSQVQEQLRENDRYRHAVPLVIEVIEDAGSN